MTAPLRDDSLAGRLLPCPFCGSEPQMWGDSGWTYIRCGNDQCIVYTAEPLPYNDATHRADAIGAWNRREAAAALSAQGWQDIATAPRDSRKVIVLISTAGPNGYVTDPWTGWID